MQYPTKKLSEENLLEYLYNSIVVSDVFDGTINITFRTTDLQLIHTLHDLGYTLQYQELLIDYYVVIRKDW